MRKIRKAKKYIYKIVTALLCLLVCIEFVLPSAAILVRAEEDVESYDDTKIEDDLEGIDLSIYPANPLGKCDIVAFMEYCYSENEKYSEVYGLYVYVYNPTQESIVEGDEYNKVNIRTAYENKSSDYEKINLEYLDKTDDKLFYKFKISESDRLLSMARSYAAENSKRRYEIIELEVHHGSTVKTTDISKAYEWTGYAVGCSSDESPISTLTCNNVGVRSVYLELMQTNYRFATQSDGYTKDELNSVFFTIPEEYFQEFGNLNNISAEWYEYKTKPMFVTSDSGAYRALWDMRNVRINERGWPVDANGSTLNTIPLSGWRVFWEEECYDSVDFSGTGTAVVNYYWFLKAFNPKCKDDIPPTGANFTLADNWSYVDKINWLFYVEDVTSSDAYVVPEKDVREYMKRYTNDFPDEWKVEQKYANSLFEMIVDEDRMSCLWQNRLKDGNGGYLRDEEGNIKTVNRASCGLVKMDFTAGDAFDSDVGNSFVDADSAQSAWNKFWFGIKYKDYNYSPIQIIKEADLIMSPEDFCELYYVNKEDAKTIMDNAKKAYANEERPVLLRFAVTDYYASAARFDFAEPDEFDLSDVDGYVAQQTVFLNFDVISLGFQNENGHKDVVIGVVANPIDIIKGLTPPDSLVPEEQEWWQKLMLVLGIILIIVLLLAFGGPVSFVLKVIYDGIKVVVSLLCTILTAPFRLLWRLLFPK
ncbi:MAG: hypothetical protein IJ488_01580 [Clostridia bacterium]|nr:hypothetical protein [Clostridia bacterium]